jgi:predicted MFS family arabinose efflux permease
MRSRALGIVEYSWAMAGIIGLFAIGRLIERFSWREPLFVVAGCLLIAAAALQTLPPDRPQRRRSERRPGEPTSDTPWLGRKHVIADIGARLRDFINLGEHWPSALSAVCVTALNFFAAFHVMIIHGGWLEQEYGLGAAQLGNVAVLLGAADWTASITVSLAGDRIGKRRSVIIGVAGMIVCFAFLPFLDVSLPAALVSIVLPRFFFEFATVSNFPLISEQLPEQRGKVLALSISGGLVGTTVAASTGPVAYFSYGVWGLGPISAASAVLSLALLLSFVRERPHDAEA